MDKGRDERPLSTRYIWRSYIFNWTSAFGVYLLVAPSYAFDSAGKVQINARIKRWISAILLA
jgi:hypothetical protein